MVYKGVRPDLDYKYYPVVIGIVKNIANFNIEGIECQIKFYDESNNIIKYDYQ